MSSYYQPSQGDYIAFDDYQIFIVWSGSATFNVYDSTDMLEFDVFTHYGATDRETAQSIAADWAEDYYTTMTEAAYNA